MNLAALEAAKHGADGGGGDLSEADVVAMSQKEQIRDLVKALRDKQGEMEMLERMANGKLKAQQAELDETKDRVTYLLSLSAKEFKALSSASSRLASKVLSKRSFGPLQE